MFTIGCVGLVFKVSALFFNVISILGTPLAGAGGGVPPGEDDGVQDGRDVGIGVVHVC